MAEEGTTAQLSVTIRGFCERSSREHRGAGVYSSRWIASDREDYRWINLCPMNIKAIFAVDEECPSYSRNGREWGEGSSWRASIKEGPEVERDFRLRSALPSDGRNRSTRRSVLYSQMRFLIVDEISSFDRRTSRRGTRNLGSWSLRRKYESHCATDISAGKSIQCSTIDHQTRTRLRGILRAVIYLANVAISVISSDGDALYI